MSQAKKGSSTNRKKTQAQASSQNTVSPDTSSSLGKVWKANKGLIVTTLLFIAVFFGFFGYSQAQASETTDKPVTEQKQYDCEVVVEDSEDGKSWWVSLKEAAGERFEKAKEVFNEKVSESSDDDQSAGAEDTSMSPVADTVSGAGMGNDSPTVTEN